MRKIIQAMVTAASITAMICATGTPATAKAVAAAIVKVPADIPVGPADENVETSRGLSAIMGNCIAAYAATDHMHAEGSYVVVSKEEDEETSYLQAKVTIDYHRPDKLAVISTSDSDNYNCRFITNGTTVTMVEAGEYVDMTQPAHLAAFSDDHRAGEVYTDYSGALAISTVAAMLISKNPANILFEGITRTIYEGEENAAEANCHRVRFIQEDPEVIVILWIDKSTWLIRKTSFIYSYDADYSMVESFEEGVNSNMSIMTWDKISTQTDTVKDAAFATGAPAGSKKVKESEQATRTYGSESSLWESIVTIAAQNSPEETTWSLSRLFGSADLQLKQFAQLPDPILDFTAIRNPETDKPLLGVATKNGSITGHNADGSIETTVSLNQSLSDFNYIDTASSGPLFLTVGDDATKLIASDVRGNPVWTYSYPYETIRHLTATTGTERAIYLSLSGRAGMRKLDETGAVLFANGKSSYVSNLTAPAGIDRLIYSRGYEIVVTDKDLHQIDNIDTDELVRSIIYDTANAAAPIVDLAISEDSDVLLQRRAQNGDIIWTTMIEPKAEDVSGSGLKWMRLKIDGEIQRCIFSFLSNGQIVITTADGKVIYRGQVSANDALVKRNEGDVVQNIAVADLNQDGVDEIYTRIDKHLMQLTTP